MPINREALRTLIRERLVDELVDGIVDSLVDAARDLARDELVQMIGSLHAMAPRPAPALGSVFDDGGERGSGQPAPHVRKDTHQGADTPGQRASAAAGNVTDPQLAPFGQRSESPSSSIPRPPWPVRLTSNGKRLPTCARCGRYGGNARGCGRSHVTLTPEERAAQDGPPPAAEDEPPRDDHAPQLVVPAADGARAPASVPVRREPAAAGSQPPAEAESSAAAAIPAAQVTDEIAGAGRWSQANSLRVATDKLEVCGLHGWIGRVAFARDRHDLCEAPAVVDESQGDDEDSDDSADADTDEGGDDRLSPQGIPMFERSGRSRRRAANAPRSECIKPRDMTVALLHDEAIEYADELAEVERIRPRTRGDCEDGLRPCPFVSCRYHLYLDITPAGSIKINFPEVEPGDLAHTCSLDVAARGGATLQEVAGMLNLTRERVRQVETRGLIAIKPNRAIRSFSGES